MLEGSRGHQGYAFYDVKSKSCIYFKTKSLECSVDPLVDRVRSKVTTTWLLE